MVDTGIFCTTATAALKAGANANATAVAEAAMNVFVREAESFINCAIRYNFSDTYASLNADVKYILEDAASSYAAIKAIQYDMSGFTSRTEAQVMLDVNWAVLRECIKLLEKKETTDFISGA